MYSVEPRHLSLSLTQRASGEAGRGIAQGESRHLSLRIIQRAFLGIESHGIDFRAAALGFRKAILGILRLLS